MSKIDVSKSAIFGKKIEVLGNGCKIEYIRKSLDYLNKECYFSDFQDFSDYKEGILKMIKVSDDIGYPYESMNDGHHYKYFIPKDKVVFEIEESKKYYRSFKTVEEFLNHVGLKNSDKVQFVEFHSRHSNSRYRLVYNGYEIDTFGVAYIHLGSMSFTLNELFNNYEYTLNGSEWLAFSVECEENEAELRK